MSRQVTLVLVDGEASVLGALPPFEVAPPWWPETVTVVAGARERFGVDVVVLRMLEAERDVPHGGGVTYLAQASGPVGGLTPVEVDLSPDHRRAAFAEVGGPAETLRWAEDRLGPLAHPVQQRTWNLSTIWRLDTSRGVVWLKQVPRFFAHEAAVLRWAAPFGPVPELLAASGPEDGRMLLADVPGEDLHRVDLATREAIAAAFHPIQSRARTVLEDLKDLGVPDGSGHPLRLSIEKVAAEHGRDPKLDKLVDGLAERLAAVEACGVPDTLVHGDLHPGNVRGNTGDDKLTILDWGDSVIGHPAFDIIRLSEGLADESLVATWVERWRAEVPGSHPARALELMRPVAELRSAVAYATFLENIEPAEHKYHAADVPERLAQAVECC